MDGDGVPSRLKELGATESPALPNTSNDNPFSEAQFKTIKYRPHFPDGSRVWRRLMPAKPERSTCTAD